MFFLFFGHTGYLCDVGSVTQFEYIFICISPCIYPVRALRALGLLLADGAPTVGVGDVCFFNDAMF